MSTLRVNKLVNNSDNGPVEFTKGVTIPQNQQIEGTLVINSVGIVTAGEFYGVGTGITTFGVENEITTSKSIAYTFIG